MSGLADQLVTGVSQHLRGRTIHKRDPILAVIADDSLAGRIQDRFVSLHGGLQVVRHAIEREGCHAYLIVSFETDAAVEIAVRDALGCPGELPHPTHEAPRQEERRECRQSEGEPYTDPQNNEQ